MSEMINRLNLKRGDYHAHHSKHLEQMFRNEADLGTWKTQGEKGGKKAVVEAGDVEGRQAYYWKRIFSLSVDEVQKGVKK